MFGAVMYVRDKTGWEDAPRIPQSWPSKSKISPLRLRDEIEAEMERIEANFWDSPGGPEEAVE